MSVTANMTYMLSDVKQAGGLLQSIISGVPVKILLGTYAHMYTV